MVRIIPNRLKPGFSNSSNTNSTTNSRSTSPMRNKGDSSPDGRKDTGLAVNVVILRVRSARFLGR
jgi:phosphatidylserine decarboxylase